MGEEGARTTSLPAGCREGRGSQPLPRVLPAFDLALLDELSDASVLPAFDRAALLGLLWPCRHPPFTASMK